MKSIVARVAVSCAIGAVAVAGVVAQGAQGNQGAQSAAGQSRDYNAEIRKLVASAKQAAAFEFQGALVRTCLQPPLSGAENTTDTVPPYVTDPSQAPPRSTWYADPAKIYDDFYFVGGKVHTAWALTTSEGIILIDTIYPYNSEELIEGGLKKLGLDPSTIKYVLITHGHGDHIGGAEMLQKKYGAKIVMGGPDWDMVEKYPNRYKTMAPKRDIVATDGMQITLGGKTVTVWLTPGHSRGTISFTFSVLERGKPVNVVTAAGVATSFINNRPDPGIKNYQIYMDSQRKMAEKAAETKATVFISNHTEFDDAVFKNLILEGHRNDPNPYEIGAQRIQNFFRVTQDCARAAQIALEAEAATGRKHWIFQ